MKFKRVVALGDMHCGHRVGLTPPKYQSQVKGKQYYLAQRECWKFWKQELKKLKPIDILIHNGDATDGDGARSGGSEIIQDRNTQIKQAIDCLSEAEPKNIVMTFGTPYHVGADIESEEMIADGLNRSGIKTTIKGQAWVDVNGTLFDCKHFVGGSSVPYGRTTAISKENMWNMYWNEIGNQPRKVGQTVFLRSHVHYFGFTGDDTYLAVILPAMQAAATKYGSRQCSGIVKFGFCHFDCYEDGSLDWTWHTLPVTTLNNEPMKL